MKTVFQTVFQHQETIQPAVRLQKVSAQFLTLHLSMPISTLTRWQKIYHKDRVVTADFSIR